MRKIIVYAAILIFIFLACQNQNRNNGYFALTATDLPIEYNGKYAYVMEGDSIIDSVLIENSAFLYRVDSVIQDKVSYLTFSEEPKIIPFIKESGNFKLSVFPSEDSGYEFTISPLEKNPNSLNRKIAEFRADLDSISRPVYEAHDRKYSIMVKNPDLSVDSVALLEKEMDELMKRLLADNDALARRYYEENKDNAVGILAFGYFNFHTAGEFIKAYESASDIIKRDHNLRKSYEYFTTDTIPQSGK